MRRLAYRTRLTIAYTAILALALLAFSAIAFAAIHVTLAAQLETRLDTMATAVRSVPDVRNGKLLFDEDDRQQFLGLLAENHINGLTATMDGHVLLSNLARPPRDLLGVIRGPDPRRGDIRVDGDTIAYHSYPIWSDNRQYGSIVVWSSRSLNNDVARTTLFVLLAATVLLIVITGVVGGALSRRMLRPVTDLSAMISEIEASDLSERLAWDGPADELGKLCTTFDRLLDRLEAAFEQQRRFTADASHELRTPLSVMRAEVELALARERTSDEYRRALQRLQAETTRLETLVESLLLTARGETVAAANVVSFGDIARRVVDRMAMPANLATVALVTVVEHEGRTHADPALLESAALALVDNAIRHTPPDGTVRVIASASESEAILTIIDSGSGFSERALHQATQRFWRDDPSRAARGTGLGLSIAQTIAARHGGRLVLRNGLGGAAAALHFPRVHEAVKSAAGR